MSVSDIAGVSDSTPLGSDEIFSEPLSWRSSFDGWATAAKIAALKVASYLTEPICKVREYFYAFYILNETSKGTAQKVMKAMFLTLGIGAFALLTPFTTPMGAVVMKIITALESKPYVYLERTGKEGKVLPENKKITVVSHNQCYVPAGYSITYGGVTPASDKNRMNANIQKIKSGYSVSI